MSPYLTTIIAYFSIISVIVISTLISLKSKTDKYGKKKKDSVLHSINNFNGKTTIDDVKRWYKDIDLAEKPRDLLRTTFRSYIFLLASFIVVILWDIYFSFFIPINQWGPLLVIVCSLLCLYPWARLFYWYIMGSE